MNELKLWTDGTETYVAESLEQAREMQFKNIDDNPEPIEAWKERTSPDPLRIHTDDHGYVTQPIADWIRKNGPGFLCSTEW